MNRINPYRRNCEVIRKFFAKSVFLVSGIALSIIIAANLIASILAKIPAAILSFNFMLIAPCAAFFMLFFMARSKKPVVSFKPPIVLMKIVSIVGIILSSLAILWILLSFVLCLFPEISTSQLPVNAYSGFQSVFTEVARLLFLIIAPCLIAVGVVLLLYFIGMLKMFNSLSKSLSDIYLHRKGALMYAITSVILSVIALSTLISSEMNMTEITEKLSVSVIFVFSAIIGFMYNFYIKKLMYTINVNNTPKQTAFETSESNNNNSPVSMWTEQDNPLPNQNSIPQPVNFNPQPVFANDSTPPATDAPKEPNIGKPKFTPQNPYAADFAPTKKHCGKCGRDNPDQNLFCGNCGARL